MWAIFANISGFDILSVGSADGLATSLWVVNVAYFYQFHNDLSDLERKTHFRRL
jgi:hypothetical protein